MKNHPLLKPEWDSFLQALGQPAMLVDENHTIIAVNNSVEQLITLDGPDIVGKKCHELFHQCTQPPAECPLVKSRDSRTHEICHMKSELTGRTFIVSCAPINADSINAVFLHTAADITDLVSTTVQLGQALNEKDVLLREVHHRVKNNMQVISSLLNLQAARTKGINEKRVLEDCRDRIQSMAFIHELMYQNDNFSEIDAGYHLQRIINHLRSSHPVSSHITIIHDCDNVSLNMDMAIPLGIITNELITNAMRHAFIGKQNGVITASLRRVADNLVLVVKDDGNGLPAHFDLGYETGMGSTLVNGLTSQLRGSISIESDQKSGTCFTLTFPLPGHS